MSQPSKSAPKWQWSASINKYYYVDDETNELVTEDGARRPNPHPPDIPRVVQAESNTATGVGRGTALPAPSGRPNAGAVGANTEPAYRFDRRTPTQPAATGSGSKEAAGSASRPAGLAAESLTPEQREARRIHAAALAQAQAQQSKRKVPSGRGSDSEPTSSQQQYSDHFAMARKRALEAGRTPDQAEAIAKEYLAKHLSDLTLSPKQSIVSPGSTSESAAGKRPLTQSSNTQPPSQPPASTPRQSHASPIEIAIRALMDRGYSRQDAMRLLDAQLRQRK